MIWLLFACKNDTNLSATEGTDSFLQNPSSAVDVLLVVDDSCSMAPYQAELGSHFGTFVSYFDEAAVDFHIGVTTTDNAVDTAGALVGPVITRETADPDAVFAGQVEVGTDGSTLEMGLETGWKAVHDPSFVREDAALTVIVVSDEEDSSPSPVNTYLNQFFDRKGGRGERNVNFTSITVTNPAECTSEQAAYATPSVRYVDVAKQTGGVIGNLCATGDAFAEIVTTASLSAARLQDRFLLSRNPDPGTLEVTVTPAGGESTVIACDAGVWTYRIVTDAAGAPTPAVVFARDQIPPAGAEVQVHYGFGSGDAARFCQ
jgi:hypothetical protein